MPGVVWTTVRNDHFEVLPLSGFGFCLVPSKPDRFLFFEFCHARHPLADCLFWLLPYIHQLAAWWAPKFQCIWVFLGETWGGAFFVGLVQPSIILEYCKISVKLGCLECFNLYDQQKNTATSKNILFSHWFSIMYASLFFMLWLQISALVPVSTRGRVLYGPG